ncbi:MULTISPECIES: [protein-PII] uridylyltransferase [Halomonas]|uniref:[protein-PII] uridylyltransferase n=1 Tax=Halomonas TaxID=2745 RepID=UPI001A8DD678|nr:MULTISPECIES: [protein-PII] uridylyltransferase [Halomonas]MED5297381.1 [protein-PII] uridylyltransferase [Pseudomonadota bacterium]MBN8411838.1 [protein-PII] uridylyltransferase [Halomonas litopenaei]MBY5923651.1 [protein-PII] uridylyltransferase [Halomonas sp. DP4Y7-2]MBY5983156.1 [protein-PII] uridylyltransferase [Halomonas sp. DP5Y7-2]MBY6230693.1 [protein-PII] uridylyltransferase [Halomonas sp. DP4Y7-1]
MLLHHYRFAPEFELFDVDDFARQLDGQRSPIAPFKGALKEIQARLDERFLGGADIRDLVRGRAWCLDQLLALAWSRQTGLDDGVALLAVGGYGRGELHPHSDIDLMFLLKDDDDTPYREALTSFITFLWDIGLEIGHSVRSLNDCAREAEADVTVITNLLESRTIAGREALRQAMRERLAAEHMWPADRFFEAKWQEQIARHYRFNNSEYHLEPNIKSSPGGLRDIQMIGWVAKRHFDTESYEDVVAKGFMNDAEHRILSQGQAFLWQVRYALHMLTGRAEDRLLFDHQNTIAELFGYRDNPERLAVEQFMKRYYRHVTALAGLNDMLLQHFDEQILRPDEPIAVTPLNERFEVAGGYIQVRSRTLFRDQPSALLELFYLMAEHPEIEGVRADTIRLIRDHRHLMDDRYRDDPRHQALFMALLRSSGNVARQLRRMNRYGVLGKYLPAFGQAVGLMQHDLFHIYTVDAHTLRLLKCLHGFRKPESKKEFPVAATLIHQVPKMDILWIAGLFHDIGKGRGGDHSLIGAREVEVFAERHGLSQRDTRLVSWLVEHHLLMSMVAQKRDITDPEVIRDFAATVVDETRLDYLYILTVADITATNPTLWNGWRASLMRQLHAETRRALRRGLENPLERDDWVRETREEAHSLLATIGADMARVDALWRSLGEDFFLQYAPSEVVWQTQGMLDHAGSDMPLILINAPTDDMPEGGTKVFIHTRSVDDLFAATAAAMEQLGLSIHDARIATSLNDWTLNTFIVLDDHDQPIRDAVRLEEIRRHLVEELDDPDDYPTIVTRHTPRQLKHFKVATQVAIEQDPNGERTLLELTAPDRPGLLARVGSIFMEQGITLSAAKIATLGERVEDVFYVTDRAGLPITDPQRQQALRERLIEVLSV